MIWIWRQDLGIVYRKHWEACKIGFPRTIYLSFYDSDDLIEYNEQWRSQPGDLVPLCKFLVIIDCEQQSISKEMNNDNVWNWIIKF